MLVGKKKAARVSRLCLLLVDFFDDSPFLGLDYIGSIFPVNIAIVPKGSRSLSENVTLRGAGEGAVAVAAPDRGSTVTIFKVEGSTITISSRTTKKL